MRSSDLWIQLKGEPAINALKVQAVDIIIETNTSFVFNIILDSGDHFEIKRATLRAARNARNAVMLKVAKVSLYTGLEC